MSHPFIPKGQDLADFPTQAGIYYGLPADTYHADKQAVSNSRLNLIRKSPAHFKHWLEYGEGKDTAALSAGRLFHMLMEGDDSIACYPGPVRRGKAWEQFKADNADKTIVTLKELGDAQAWELAMKDAPLVKALLPHGIHEVTAVAQMQGVLVKARADFLVTDGPYAGALVDWKSVADASPEGFLRSVDRYRYAEQAALYLAVFEKAGWPISWQFLFACVEKEPPHVTQVYELDADILEIARRNLATDLNTLKVCRERNEWPGYCDDEVVILDAPQHGRLAPAAITWQGMEVAL